MMDELNDEEKALLGEEPDMIVAFNAQNDIFKLLEEWSPKIRQMTDVQKSRHWWAAMDAMLCVMYRVLPHDKADRLLALILSEIKAGRG